MVPSKKERKSKNQNQILKFNKKITNYLIYSFKGKVKKSLLDSGTRDWETTGEKGKRTKRSEQKLQHLTNRRLKRIKLTVGIKLFRM